MPAPDPAVNAIGALLLVSVLIPVAGWRHWFGRIRNRDFIAWADRPDKWLAAKSLAIIVASIFVISDAFHQTGLAERIDVWIGWLAAATAGYWR